MSDRWTAKLSLKSVDYMSSLSPVRMLDAALKIDLKFQNQWHENLPRKKAAGSHLLCGSQARALRIGCARRGFDSEASRKEINMRHAANLIVALTRK
jgi:hypothetical protein